MKTLHFILQNDLKVMVIPDTEAHLDGHTIITHTYSVFKDIDAGNPLIARSKESTLHLELIKDPYYFGTSRLKNPVPYLLIRQMDKWN